MQPNPWLIRQSGGTPHFRLYCFSYAGGNASAYASWQAGLKPGVEICAIQLPGRGRRLSETPYQEMEPLVEALAGVITHDNKIPFAFFGHSLGALLSFEVARYLALHLLPLPKHLFASGCDAPQFRSRPRNLHRMPQEELIEALRNYNGTPAEILAHSELMALLSPTIRADFALAEKYRYRPSLMLDIPISAMVGEKDTGLLLEKITGWGQETSGVFDVKWFEGDHFYIAPEREAVLHYIDSVIDAIVR